MNLFSSTWVLIFLSDLQIEISGVSVVHFKVEANEQCKEISTFINLLCVRYPSVHFFKVAILSVLNLIKSFCHLHSISTPALYHVPKDSINWLTDFLGCFPHNFLLDDDSVWFLAWCQSCSILILTNMNWYETVLGVDICLIVLWLKVDVEESLAVAKAEGIRMVPTFKIYKNGDKVKEMICPTHQYLEDSVRNYIL